MFLSNRLLAQLSNRFEAVARRLPPEMQQDAARLRGLLAEAKAELGARHFAELALELLTLDLKILRARYTR